MKKILVSLIQEQLLKIPITGSTPSMGALSLKELDEIKKVVGKEFLNAQIIDSVINDLTFKELSKIPNWEERDEATEMRLSDFPEVDVNTLSKQICDLLNSLPRKYTFVFKLPSYEGEIPYTKLSHNIELGSIKADEFKSLLPRSEEDYTQPYGFYIGPGYEETEVILRIQAQGYVSLYSKVKVNFTDPLYIFKVTIGIYSALGITHRREKRKLFVNYEVRYFVYDVLDNKRVRTLFGSFDDTNYLTGIELNPDCFQPSELNKYLKINKTQFEEVNEILINLFANNIPSNEGFDKRLKTYKHKIKNGAYWLYESLKTREEHVRVIYLTTAFDSLVDTRVNEATKEHKADLIVSALGDNAMTADMNRDIILKLYTLRNDIVHGIVPISSLNQYEENDDKRIITVMGVQLLRRFFANRIHFVNKTFKEIRKPK